MKMEKIQLLEKMSIFHGLKPEDLKKIEAIATDESFVPGSTIISEGAEGDALYGIKSGTVRVVKRGKDEDEEISRMGPGQHFGEMAIIEHDKRSATIDAQEYTELIKIKKDDLDELLSHDDELGHRVYRSLAIYLCRRLRQTTNDLSFMRGLAKRHGH
jgi:CRP-like cAMP-binding protein